MVGVVRFSRGRNVSIWVEGCWFHEALKSERSTYMLGVPALPGMLALGRGGSRAG